MSLARKNLAVPVWLAAVFASAFALPGAALAQGLTGGLEGLLAAYLMVWVVGGIVPAGMLLGAFAVARDEHGQRKSRAWFLALPATLYIPTVLPWVFVPDAYIVGKVCAVVGFVFLHALIAFVVVDRKRLARRLHVVTGVLFAALIVTPTSFWERPLVSFERVEFIDNLAGRDANGFYYQSGHAVHWLALDDGRRLFTIDRLAPGPVIVARSRVSAERVVLEPLRAVQGDDGQQRFGLTFYNRTDRFRRSTTEPQPRFVIGMKQTSASMYEEQGARGAAILLDRDTQVDYAAELIAALRAGMYWLPDPEDEGTVVWQSWVRLFIELGDIDIGSPQFLDRAFRADRYTYLITLLGLGMDPGAVDSRGNTVLHIAARNDSAVFEGLLQFDILPDAQNRAGRTALDEARRTYGGTPQAWRVDAMGRALERWRAARR